MCSPAILPPNWRAIAVRAANGLVDRPCGARHFLPDFVRLFSTHKTDDSSEIKYRIILLSCDAKGFDPGQGKQTYSEGVSLSECKQLANTIYCGIIPDGLKDRITCTQYQGKDYA